jgi:cobalt/nickel transport system permease protein
VANELNLPYSWTVFLTVSLKAWLSTLYLILLSSTIRFPDLLKALEKLKMPHIIILTLSFMYRYIFVFQDEALRMKRARDARSREGNVFWHINSLGSIIGSLFIRAYERGERVYKAMLARGFDGEVSNINEFNLKPSDLIFLISSSLFLLTIRVIG